MKKKQIAIFVFLVLACLVNLSLSGYIMLQKTHNDAVTIEECFLGDGGCYTVQTSSYASTFGVPNPYYGYMFFSFGLLLFTILTYLSLKTNDYLAEKYKHLCDLIEFFLAIGAGFSAYLLLIQFLVLKATCIYCVIVDVIMITMLVVFMYYKRMYKNE